MKLRLLRLLQTRPGQWVVMEAFCRELAAAPQDLIAAANALRCKGFQIEVSPVSGYRYVVSPEPLWDRLLQPESCRRIGRRIQVRQSTTSSNDLARQAAADPANDGLVVFTEFQTAGRGRQGAVWTSPAGMNLLFSVLLIDVQKRLKPHLVTLAAGLALARAVGEVTNLHARLKWPNDLLIDSKKVAGILVEFSCDSNNPAVIIGMGLDCNCLEADLPAGASSLRQITGDLVDRHALARAILTHLESWIDCCLGNQEQKIRTAYLELSDLLGQTVRLSSQGRTYSGRIVDLDPFQGILVQLDRGGVRLFQPATTSLLT